MFFGVALIDKDCGTGLFCGLMPLGLADVCLVGVCVCLIGGFVFVVGGDA